MTKTEAFEWIPPDFRTLLLLREDGVSYAKIADRTGLPIGTVKSRLNRGRYLLSIIMAVDGDDIHLGDLGFKKG